MAARSILSSAVVAIIAAVAALFTGALAVSAATAAAVIGKPGCVTRCGDVSVPFPFGMGPGRCSARGFNLTCDNTTRPGKPRLLLGEVDGIFEVKEISTENRTLRVVTPPIFSKLRIGSIPGVVKKGSWGGELLEDRYVLSTYGVSRSSLSLGSDLVVVGCNIEATMHTKIRYGSSYVAGCSSYCAGDRALTADDVRNYTGYCSYPIDTGATYFDMELKRLQGDGGTTINNNLPVSVLIIDGDTKGPELLERLVHLMNLDGPPSSKEDEDDDHLLLVPVILRWSCGMDGSCTGNVSSNSLCEPDQYGYLLLSCKCVPGYAGNPYVTGGCQDIDECKNKREYGCFGECSNKNGSFECRCPRGYHGNATQPQGCIKSQKNTGLSIIIGVSCGAGVVLLVLAVLFIPKLFKRRQARMLRRKFFVQNHGQLLEQLVSQNAGIAERMIITLDELEKATHNFDKDLVVGSGGQGTVYKGILSNQHIVAIKKPKKLDQKEIGAFIKEIAILSQINHRNVVKLYGCCLETEVPMLIYEFISNGTLSEHLHVDGPKSLSWDNRLRIAIEAAKSIAYLHSTAAIPIIHRDIKSANILLDDTLTTKVADFGASRNIPIEKSGLTTMVQGTRGYWDPACFYTGRLTEKSDVFSFGIVLMELLTRKKPYSYLSSDDEALIVHFSTLFVQGNLLQILDPQVVQEGAKEAGEVATLAVACIKFTPEDRPTMRQVELTLEGIRASKASTLDNTMAENVCENDIAIDVSSAVDRSSEGSTRRYSMEEEFALSGRYSR